MSMLDVTCFGSVTMDHFLHPQGLQIADHDGAPHMLIPVGAKFSIDQMFDYAGGGGANCAIGFAKMNLRVGLGAVLGGDDNADLILHQLRRYNINTDSVVQIAGGQTSSSTIIMTDDGRRTVLCRKLRSEQLNGDTLLQARPTRSLYISHLPPVNESILQAIPQWKKQNPQGIVAWNPGKTQFAHGLGYFKKALPHINVLIVNHEESAMFSRVSTTKTTAEQLDAKRVYAPLFDTKYVHDERAAAQVFLDAGVEQVLITDGKRGAQFLDKNGTWLWCPAQDGTPVNTLGAGDAFSVGAVSARLAGLPPHWMMRWGALNSFATCQRFGAQAGQLTEGQIKRIMPMDCDTDDCQLS